MKHKYGRLRLLTLWFAFILIAVNPLLNYYFSLSFIQGWYQSLGIGRLWFVSPLEGLESLLVTRSIYMPSLVGMMIPLLLAFLLGRVFCSWICPISLFTELLDRARRKINRKQFLNNRLVVVKRVLWLTLICELLFTMVLGAPLFVFLSPPGLVGREIMMLVFFGKLAVEGVLILLILCLELLTRRFFCRSFCPLGALLALVGKPRRLKVLLDTEACSQCGVCDRACSMGIRPSIGESTSAYCWNCGECVDYCSQAALQFKWADNSTSPR